MTPEELERIQVCASEIAKILYKNTPLSELANLETIEKHLRQQWLDLLGPQIGFCFIKKTTGTDRGQPCPKGARYAIAQLKAATLTLTITEKQAEKLALKKSTRFSPLFEKCCLRQLANIAYEKTSQEIAAPVGRKYRSHLLASISSTARMVRTSGSDRSFRGQCGWRKSAAKRARGCARRSRIIGEGTRWLDYKAVRFQSSYYAAFFQQNHVLVN
jgi:hypothetical protein